MTCVGHGDERKTDQIMLEVVKLKNICNRGLWHQLYIKVSDQQVYLSDCIFIMLVSYSILNFMIVFLKAALLKVK